MSESTAASSSSPSQPPRMVAVRRRSRRRRTMEPVDWRRLYTVIGATVVALFLMINKPANEALQNAIHAVLPKLNVRLEVIALGIAGIIWIYLTPGVEDRVLRFFKIRSEQKKAAERRRRRERR